MLKRCSECTIWSLRLSPTQGIIRPFMFCVNDWARQDSLAKCKFSFVCNTCVGQLWMIINMHITVFHYNMDGCTKPGSFPDWTKIPKYSHLCDMVQNVFNNDEWGLSVEIILGIILIPISRDSESSGECSVVLWSNTTELCFWGLECLGYHMIVNFNCGSCSLMSGACNVYFGI